MSFQLTDLEWSMLRKVPVEELIELAADLAVLIPEGADRRTLIESSVPRIVDRGRQEHLPFSKYDLDDLKALSQAQLDTLGDIQGVRKPASVRSVLRVGQRAYKARQKNRMGSDPFAYMIPILLTPILRCAMQARSNR
jgi:hypothetical protein